MKILGLKVPFTSSDHGGTKATKGKMKMPSGKEAGIFKPVPEDAKNVIGGAKPGVVQNSMLLTFLKGASADIKFNRDNKDIKGKITVHSYEGAAIDTKDNKSIEDGYFAKNVRFIVKVTIPNKDPGSPPLESEIELNFAFKVKETDRTRANKTLSAEKRLVEKLIIDTAKKELKGATPPINLKNYERSFKEKITQVPKNIDKDDFEDKRKSKISPKKVAVIESKANKVIEDDQLQKDLQTLKDFSRMKDPNKELKLSKEGELVIVIGKISKKEKLEAAYHVGGLAMIAYNKNIDAVEDTDKRISTVSKNASKIGLSAILNDVIPHYQTEALQNPVLGKTLITALTFQYVDPRQMSILEEKVKQADEHKEILTSFAKMNNSISKNDLGETRDPEALFNTDLDKIRETLTSINDKTIELGNIPKKEGRLTTEEKSVLELKTDQQEKLNRKFIQTRNRFQEGMGLAISGALDHLESKKLTNSTEYKQLSAIKKAIKDGHDVDVDGVAQILKNIQARA